MEGEFEEDSAERLRGQAEQALKCEIDCPKIRFFFKGNWAGQIWGKLLGALSYLYSFPQLSSIFDQK